jgi:hypothetical protein
MKRFICGTLFAWSMVCAGRAADDLPGKTLPLFNGRNLDGWEVVVGDKGVVANQNLVQVVDGVIHVYKDAVDGSEQPFGYLLTIAEYGEYRLSLEYKWGTKKFAPRADADTVRDAGVCYHVRAPLEIWPTSVECQIQEGDTGDVWAIHTQVTSTIHSDIMNYCPAEDGGIETTRGDDPRGYRRFLRSYCYEQPGWNRVELIVSGDRATYLVNGHVANRVTKLKSWDEATASWQPLTKGKILLQAEGAEIFYRNVTIQPLTAAVTAP